MIRTSAPGPMILLLALVACTPAPKEVQTTVAAVEVPPPASVAVPPTKVEPAPTKAPPAAPTKTPPAEVAPPVAVAPTEALGGIALGTSLADLKKQLPGGTAELPPVEDSGTPGLFGRTLPPPDERWLWTYDKAGLHAVLASATDQGPWRVVHLTANGRAKHRTKAGIGVGSTIAQVRAAYPSAVFDHDFSAIVAISAQEQLDILFEDGRATHVVLAPGG